MFLFKTPKESPGLLFWKVNKQWEQGIKQLLKPFGLSHSQFVVLANTHFINLEKEEVTQIDVATSLGIDKMMVTIALKVLIGEKLVTRKESMVDTRAKNIKLTKKGETLLTAAIKEVEGFDRTFFNSIKNLPVFNQNLSTLLR